MIYIEKMNYNLVDLTEIETFQQTNILPARLRTAEQIRLFRKKADAISKVNGTYFENNKRIILDINEKKHLILKAYLDPSSSVAYRGFPVVHAEIYKSYANISQSFVRDVINSSESKQLHAPPKRTKIVNRTYTDLPNSQISIDETQFINGYFILLAVDQASKKLWGALKKSNFTKPDVIRLIEDINIATQNTPIIIADNGQIFNLTPEEVPNKIIHTKIYTSQANGRIESYNKKVKELMLRYIDNGSVISRALLKKAIDSLNSSVSNSIKLGPDNASNMDRINTIVRPIVAIGPKLVKGDFVRIQNTTTDLSLRKDVTYKSSHVKHWSDEIFQINRVIIPRTPTQTHYYLLNDQADKRYYDHDLLKIPNNSPVKTAEFLFEKNGVKSERVESTVKPPSLQKKKEISDLEWRGRRHIPSSEKRTVVSREVPKVAEPEIEKTKEVEKPKLTKAQQSKLDEMNWMNRRLQPTQEKRIRTPAKKIN
jgi:hypothetical protein